MAGLQADVLARHLDAPLSRHFEKIDASQEGALARARGAYHRDDIALMSRQRHAFQNLEIAEALVEPLDDDRGLPV